VVTKLEALISSTDIGNNVNPQHSTSHEQYGNGENNIMTGLSNILELGSEQSGWMNVSDEDPRPMPTPESASSVSSSLYYSIGQVNYLLESHCRLQEIYGC
jgi:hypothetical protein